MVGQDPHRFGKVRTRFAPSPTGFLHIGSLRTALYSYALAKNKNGDFILRIEDTDQKREVPGAVESLIATLKKFGINYDEFYVQSERVKTGIYEKAAKKLVKEGHAFYCNCEPKDVIGKGYSTNLRDFCRDKNLNSGAIRLRVPDGQKVSYYDFVHKKEISWDTDTVYDATLLKSDGFPTYHLAAMVDDLDMRISHILRGHDWLPSTPIHLLVLDFLGMGRPEIGHLTDILSGTTGKKLSKRRDSVFVEQFLEQGFLPEALLNFVMLLGWAPKDNRELFTLEEFVKAFDINGFQKANPRFLEDKLFWMNSQYIQKSQISSLKSRIFKFFEGKYSEEMIEKILPLVQTRIKTLKEFEELAGFFFEKPKVEHKLFGENYKDHLKTAKEVLESLDKWTLEDLNEGFMKAAEKNKFRIGDFFMSLRIAITGSKFTPPINESIIILGKDEVLDRLNKALSI